MPVINQMERTLIFHRKFFEKKGIPSEVFLFSSFHRNDRKILFHLQRVNSSMLPGELNARLNAEGKTCLHVQIKTAAFNY